MRLTAIILAIYTLALSVAPCNDVHAGQTAFPMTMQAAHEHHQEDNDVCSPFCLCSCCQGFVIIALNKHFEAVPVVSGKNFTLLIEQIHSTFAARHWQPPKIS